jgi:hypothetical protein
VIRHRSPPMPTEKPPTTPGPSIRQDDLRPRLDPHQIPTPPPVPRMEKPFMFNTARSRRTTPASPAPGEQSKSRVSVARSPEDTVCPQELNSTVPAFAVIAINARPASRAPKESPRTAP